MSRRTAFNWFFVIYLVLFMNLGPSFHGLDLFGLHQSDSSTALANSCSCHHHSQPENNDTPVVGGDHDCSFCEFFDQYNLTIHSIECFDQVEFFTSISIADAAISRSFSISGNARAPPVA